MTTWDRRPPRRVAALQDTLLRAQLQHAVAPFSPFWRAQAKTLGRSLADVTSVQQLATIPAVGESDLCADGNPADAAALVLQADEASYAMAAEGPVVRKALVRRLLSRDAYTALLEADTRPVSYVEAGLAVRFPVASTRADLDVLARTGARLWSVLGLTRADVLVSGVPAGATIEQRGLEYAALAAGAPALFPADLAAALAAVPATVLALPSGPAADLLAGLRLDTVRTVLLVGAPSEDERAAVEAAAPGRTVLAVHAPSAARVLWAECREGGAAAGLHTYPDVDVVQTVDPETGVAASDGPVELVLTQLGLKGSALVRWRTGDLITAITRDRCPGCGRTVARVLGTRRGALVPTLSRRRSDPTPVDLRVVAGALAGRADLQDWSVVLNVSARDATDELLVHIATSAAAPQTAVAVTRDIRAAAGVLPSQVVLGQSGRLPAGPVRVTRRISAGR